MITAAVFSPAITPGDPDKNVSPILDAMQEARAKGASLLLLPPLCLTGCSCGDMFQSLLLRANAELALRKIVESSAGIQGLTTVVGLPLQIGHELFSCAAVVREGSLLGVCPRTGDSRWFSRRLPVDGEIAPAALPAVPFSHSFTFSVGELTVAWEGFADALLLHQDDASDVDSIPRLSRLLERTSGLGNATLCACPGEGESTTDFVYTGFAGAAANGELLSIAEGEMILVPLHAATDAEEAELPAPAQEPAAFSPAEGLSAPPLPRSPFFPGDAADTARRCDRVFDLQVRALVARMQRTFSRKLVLGISGGLDSALAMLVSAEALRRLGLPAENLVALTMPCFGTTRRTRSNAELISEALGAEFRTVDITAAVEQHFRDIGHDMSVHNSAFENAQARQRTYVLMDLANDVGGLVVGTGDLSELALGWCTYNGDHMSMYAVNAGVPKTAVRLITARRAETCGNPSLAAVLRDILDTPITPELLPNASGETPQLTEDLVGPYDLHDFFLHHFLTEGPVPSLLLQQAQDAFAPDYAPETVEKWLKVFLKRFFSQQFKRSCMPDGPAVFGVSLSPREGFLFPSDFSSAPWLRNLE